MTFKYGYRTASSMGNSTTSASPRPGNPRVKGWRRPPPCRPSPRANWTSTHSLPQDLSVKDVERLRPVEGTDIEVTAE